LELAIAEAAALEAGLGAGVADVERVAVVEL
jgi:hypothetical protein